MPRRSSRRLIWSTAAPTSRSGLWAASQGSIAAVGGGARLGDKIAGIVVTSSITGRSSSGETLFDSEPALVAVPTLIVANTADVCPASSPGDTPKIFGALVRAARKEVIYMLCKEVAMEGQCCEARSPRSYFGIQAATLARIAEWIDATISQPMSDRDFI